MNDLEFIYIWNHAATSTEAAHKAGISRGAAYYRAKKLRDQGHKLKPFALTRAWRQHIGRLGGSKRVPKGFAMNRQLASEAGHKSRRTKR